MAYVVLARKYRPLQFAHMVGQEHVTRTLSQAIEHDRVHHAYLFAGARGLGKTSTARILARALVCERGPTPTPCGECIQCRAVLDGSSPDVIEIDGASNNSVSDIRSLREQVHYLPQSARRKIYIIDEVHMLSKEAFNALLKTLEEPPEHVSFIFATTEAHKLLPTILSRVSRLDFRRLSSAQLTEHLQNVLKQEGLTMDAGAVGLVARAAQGSVRDALTLLDQVIAFGQTESLTEAEARQVLGLADVTAVGDLVGAVLDRDPGAALSRLDAIIAAGTDLGSLAGQILEQLRDLTVVKLCGDREDLVDATDAERARLRELSSRVEAPVLGQLFDRFSRTVEALPLSRTQRLTFEMGLLDLVHADPVRPIGSLVDRLEALAAGQPAPSGGGGGGSRAPRARSTPRARPAPTEPARSRSQAPAAERPPRPESAPPPSGPISGKLLSMARESGVISGGGREPGPRSAPAPEPDPEPDPEPAPQPAAPASGSPAPATGPQPRIVWEELPAFDAWERLLVRVRERDEFLSAVLGELGLQSLGGGVIRLAAPPGSFGHTQCTTQPEIRAGLEQAMLEHFGAPFQFELVDGEASLPDLPSLVLVEGQRQAERQAAAEHQARSSPALQSVLQTFEGTLGRTKPLD